MHQVEKPTSNPIVPLHSYKTLIINKGYSHKEVQEDGAIVSIFKAAGLDEFNASTTITIVHEN